MHTAVRFLHLFLMRASIDMVHVDCTVFLVFLFLFHDTRELMLLFQDPHESALQLDP